MVFPKIKIFKFNKKAGEIDNFTAAVAGKLSRQIIGEPLFCKNGSNKLRI